MWKILQGGKSDSQDSQHSLIPPAGGLGLGGDTLNCPLQNSFHASLDGNRHSLLGAFVGGRTFIRFLVGEIGDLESLQRCPGQ